MPLLENLLFRNNFSGANNTNCSCLVGQAVTNSDGTCSCIDTAQTTQVTLNNNPLTNLPNKSTIKARMLSDIKATQTVSLSDNAAVVWVKQNPLLALGLAGAIVGGFFLLKSDN